MDFEFAFDADKQSLSGDWLWCYPVTLWWKQRELWCVPEEVPVSAPGHAVGSAPRIALMTFGTSFPNGACHQVLYQFSKNISPFKKKDCCQNQTQS